MSALRELKKLLLEHRAQNVSPSPPTIFVTTSFMDKLMEEVPDFAVQRLKGQEFTLNDATIKVVDDHLPVITTEYATVFHTEVSTYRNSSDFGVIYVDDNPPVDNSLIGKAKKALGIVS